MNEESKQKKDLQEQLYEEYEHSLFRLAAFQALEREGETCREEMEQVPLEERKYPSEQQLEHFKRQIKKDLGRKKKSWHWQRLTPVINVAAIVVLVVTFVFSALVMNVEAVRHRVLNVVLTKEKESTLFQLEEVSSEGTAAVMEASPGYWPSYIPEGYHLVERDVTGSITSTVYMRGEDHYLTLTEALPEGYNYLDSENADREETIWINGNEGLFIEKNGHFLVTWGAHERIFILGTELSLEETKKVAESIGYQEK